MSDQGDVTADALFYLNRAGWSIGSTAYATPARGIAWAVDGRNGENVIRKTKSACRNSGHQPSDHFVDVTRMLDIGCGGRRAASDVHRTRFGCYLVAMNGGPDKAEVAAAQECFALMTRAAEKAIAVPAAIIESPRPWSARFRETTQDHFCYITTHQRGNSPARRVAS